MSAVAQGEGAGLALAVGSLVKAFGDNVALSLSELTVRAGEIHVLVGENGSGKSTLIKTLSGYHSPDAGEVLINGEPLAFGSPEFSYRHGLRFVHQDLGLIAAQTVLDNLAMGFGYPTRLGTIRTSSAIRSAQRALKAIGLEVSPRSRIGELSAAQRTGVAVARALREDPAHPPAVLVLDEPTATLPADEVDQLLRMLRTAARAGLGILFVTHHLDEVFRVADRVSVVRDGRLVATADIAAVDRPQLVRWLVGENFRDIDRAELRASPAPAVLVVDRMNAPSLLDVSFSVAPGEIVGIAGLTGSGRESLLGTVFGSAPRESGTVTLDGAPVAGGRPDLAIGAGIGFMPSDRKTDGGFMTLSARENLTMADLAPFSSAVRVDRKKEATETATWFARLQVRPARAYDQVLSGFSGGNQQKILFGKWLRLPLKAFLVDEPTQGVDIGAKAQLHRQLMEVAQKRTAVVIASTDVEELAAVCTRVIVLRAGRISAELTGRDLTEATIKNHIMSDAVAGEASIP